jgi:hypothetical protein
LLASRAGPEASSRAYSDGVWGVELWTRVGWTDTGGSGKNDYIQAISNGPGRDRTCDLAIKKVDATGSRALA